MIAPANIYPRYLSGGAWKVRKIEKEGKGRHEAGKTKGIMPTTMQRFCCRNSRAYRTVAQYDAIMASCGSRKKG